MAGTHRVEQARGGEGRRRLRSGDMHIDEVMIDKTEIQ
jgi:hypothetical protein